MNAPAASSPYAVVLRRPVAIFMVTLAVVVFGVFSYRLLPVELMPDITYPSLTVRTVYPGAAPQETEEHVTRPLEEALGVVGGLVRLVSVSRAELSDITLEFNWGTPMGRAWQEVNERLDTVLLPETAEKPIILRYDPSLDPVVRLALASRRAEDQTPEGLRRLRTFAEQELKRRLEQVEGVAAVRVLGGLEEQVSVELREEALRRTGLSIQEVVRRLGVENVNLAGGDLREGDTQYLVRTVNEFRSLEEIADLVVGRREGRELRLRDIGVVRSGWADREVITRFNGSEAVEIEIQKEADANMVAMADAVRRALAGDPAAADAQAREGLRGLLPRGWELELLSDRSTFIRAAVADVRDAAVIGGLLAVLVLYLFLRDFRTTAVISVAIPVSVVATFAPMNLSGLSLNIMSLGGLALGIGMLVDSGIVVVESIARCREEGDAPDAAVVRGTAEVGGAVVASTLTSVAVFAPMVFVIGVAGQVFADLALTVVYALVASLFAALFVVPALVAKLQREAGEPRLPLGRRLALLRYRSLGPLSQARSGMAGIVAALSGGMPLCAVGAWIASRAGLANLAWAAAGVALALAAAALVANAALRLAEPGARARRLGRVLAGLVFDPVVLALEGVWLGAVWMLVLAVVPLRAALGLAGWLLGRIAAPFVAVVQRGIRALQRAYPAFVRAALGRPAWVLGAAALGTAAMVLGLLRLDSALIPEVHQGEFDLELELPVGTPIERTLQAVAPLEAQALADARVGRTLLTVGADPEADSGPEEGEHTARLTVHLAPPAPPAGLAARVRETLGRLWLGLRYAGEGGVVALREEAVAADLRAALERLPEVEGRVVRPVLFSFRTPVEVEVEAFDLEQLQRLGERAAAVLAAIPGLRDVETSARLGSPEVQIVYDRQELVRRGLDVRAVADLVRTKIRGTSATEYRQRERRVDIVVRLDPEDRTTLRQLANLVVNPGDPVPVPLSAVAEIRLGTAPADIRRVGQRRVALVTANVEGRGLASASREIAARLGALDWPEGTGWRLSGQVQEMERSMRSLWLVLAIAVFLVYVVMASQFESILHPLLIMVTVPLALLGVVAVLWWLAIPLSVVVFLGMIMLAGIVVNNAIVFVDYTNRLRARGLGLEDALAEAGRVRLRPILMTTGTTVLGLLPMAVGLGDGAELRVPMALTVIAGLVTSTALTLVVLPTLYAVVEKALGGLRARAGAPSPRLVDRA